MNIQTLKTVLPLLMKARVTPFIWGSQGIGKTQSVKQVAASLNYSFVHLHMATLEVGDLVGLLHKQADGTVSHLRPKWFPTEEKTIIFLDELNRMHPDVMQSLFSFITDGTIHTHKLPLNCHIIAAGNYQTTDFQVTDTSDSAWMSRFCHIDLQPSVEEFIVHAESRGASSIASFAREHSNLIETTAKNRFNFSSVTPDRRSLLDYVNPLDQLEMNDTVRYEIYQGLLGPSVAAAYLSHKKTATTSVTIGQILDKYPLYKSKVAEMLKGEATRFDLLTKPVDELMVKLETDPALLETGERLTNLKQFLLDVPLELSQKAFKELSRLQFAGKKDILNDMAYCAQIAGRIESTIAPKKKAKKEAAKEAAK